MRTIVIYGALRSGTTLLRLMMDAHQSLSCPGETDFLFDHLSMTNDGPMLDEKSLEQDRIYRNHRDYYSDNPLSHLTPDSLIERIAGQKNIAVLMLHRNLPRALDLYPDLPLIHLVRDPRDVARSSIGMGWAGTVYHGIDHWIRTEIEWRFCKDRLATGQHIQISYEDLIARPEEILTEICDFCGVQFSSEMLDYDRETTYSKPDKSLTEQWKRKQTHREVGLVEGKIGSLLEASGYEPSGYDPVHPGFLERLLLSWQNKKAIWKTRVSRYGLADPLLVAICNRIGAKSLAAGARRRMDDKIVKYLK